ncbi:uncharacterized protein VTP21DRAFT_2161 [Calcarisporiella thermophila]|uniref:uncharacterized protein n=1 Tax=Calcarisporiella thermophila TaxID=911321 RepID=UPI003743281C
MSTSIISKYSSLALNTTQQATTASKVCSRVLQNTSNLFTPVRLTSPNSSITLWKPFPTPLNRDFRKEDFVLIEILGTGTFGKVYLAQLKGDPSGNYYAMKVLSKAEAVRLKQIEHINSEQVILNQLQFPFIVNLYCAFQDEYSLSMLLEFMIGGELFTYLRRAGRFSNEVARFYAAELVLVLEYLHEKSIIYRDLKPENLLLDEKGHIKVTDFGFAKRIDGRTWTLCGTPEYLAPEIIQSKGHGKEVDWWALGVLIFEMLAGHPPFFDENPFENYAKILAGHINFPDYFDPLARDLITRILELDHTKRLGRGGAAEVKAHAWFQGVDWKGLLNKEIKPPIIPRFRHPGDTCNFEN